MGNNIRHFRALDVYKLAFGAAMEIYEHILGKLVIMMSHLDQWIIKSIREEEADYA